MFEIIFKIINVRLTGRITRKEGHKVIFVNLLGHRDALIYNKGRIGSLS